MEEWQTPADNLAEVTFDLGSPASPELIDILSAFGELEEEHKQGRDLA